MKKAFEKTFLDFKKWIKSIQTAGYNGACTVFQFYKMYLYMFSFDKNLTNLVPLSYKLYNPSDIIK